MQTHPLRRWWPMRGPSPTHHLPPKAMLTQDPLLDHIDNFSPKCLLHKCAMHRYQLFPLQPTLVYSPPTLPLQIPAWWRRYRSPLPWACTPLHVSNRQLRGHPRRPSHIPTLDLHVAGPHLVCPPFPGRLTPSLLQAWAASAPHTKSSRSTQLDQTPMLPTKGHLVCLCCYARSANA